MFTDHMLMMWLMLALGTAIIAWQKNRSQGGWFVAGVLFGPFALLIILLADTVNPLAKEEPAAPVAPMTDEELKRRDRRGWVFLIVIVIFLGATLIAFQAGLID